MVGSKAQQRALSKRYLDQIVGKGWKVPLLDFSVPASSSAVSCGQDDVAHASGSAAAQVQAMQDMMNQQLSEAHERHQKDTEDLYAKQQEAAQMTLILEAAEQQVAIGKRALGVQHEEPSWRKRLPGRDLCVHWARGYCLEGELCRYPHTADKKGCDAPQRSVSQRIAQKYKSEICKNFTVGRCRHGADCIFAHSQHDLRVPGTPLTAEDSIVVERLASIEEQKGAAGLGIGMAAEGSRMAGLGQLQQSLAAASQLEPRMTSMPAAIAAQMGAPAVPNKFLDSIEQAKKRLRSAMSGIQ